MQACLLRNDSQRCYIFTEDCLFKTKFERLFQTLFYEVFSLEELSSKP
jgi:hypothetical protein